MASDEARERFLALNGAKLPPRERPERDRTLSKGGSSNSSRKSLARTSGPKRTKGIRQESPKQTDRRKGWSFIRACFLICQRRTDGFYSCQECGLQTNNAKHLDLDHIERRLPNNYVPQNAMLLCNRLSENGENSCHVRKTGTLQWSKGESA